MSMPEQGIDLDQLERMLADAEASAQRYQAAAAELEDAVVTVASEDRSVTVDVAYGQGLSDLRLTQDALDRGTERLGPQIVALIASAQGQLARQMADRLQGDVTDIDLSQWLPDADPDTPDHAPRQDHHLRFDPPER